MALDINQQIAELIEHASHILLTTSATDSGDGMASLLSLKLFLNKMNKPTDIIVTPTLKNQLSFLSGSENIKTSTGPLKKLIVSLNTQTNKVKEFNYDLHNDELKIYITPEQNEFKKEDVKIQTSNYKYDLIFSVGCPDLESLGDFYYNHSDFFFKTTIINIDNNPSNERYGQINHIDLNLSSCSEIVFSLIGANNSELINKEIATNILAGLIIKTDNFRSATVTPNCLHTASYLMELSADQAYIINNLNKNKSITALNLWGRVLARLKQDTHYHLAWSLISQNDFQKSGGTIEDLSGVVSELISHSPLVDITILLYELPTGTIDGQIFTSANYNALDLTAAWQGVGNKNQAHFQLSERKLITTEQMVINQIREIIRPAH